MRAADWTHRELCAEVELSILYLRCDYYVTLPMSARLEAFNSLFEMPPGGLASAATAP